MPLLPSSNMHLDILMGKDEMIDYEDFLNGKFVDCFKGLYCKLKEKLTNRLC